MHQTAASVHLLHGGMQCKHAVHDDYANIVTCLPYAAAGTANAGATNTYLATTH